jgi:pyrrolidone-carboxylate peptidase
MKMLFLLLYLLTAPLWAKPVVLVSYYDSFGNAPFNNSEIVALALSDSMNRSKSSVQIKLCALNTVFDKAYAQVEDCLNSSDKMPILYIGLGEGKCNLKVETTARNRDNTKGADNEGNERTETEIIDEGSPFIGMRYPLPQMYCGLNKKNRSQLEISNDAGSFVCNNTAYQLSYYYPELKSGFIHVPSNHCRNLEKRNEFAVMALTQMIVSGVDFLNTHYNISPNTPHTSNHLELPTSRNEINTVRSTYRQNSCIDEFFKRTRGVDERGFWSFPD